MSAPLLLAETFGIILSSPPWASARLCLFFHAGDFGNVVEGEAGSACLCLWRFARRGPRSQTRMAGIFAIPAMLFQI